MYPIKLRQMVCKKVLLNFLYVLTKPMSDIHYSVQYSFDKEDLQRRMDYLETIERLCREEQGEEVARSFMPSITRLVMKPTTIVCTKEEIDKFAEIHDYYD